MGRLKNTKILITGASGYIGRNLKEYLKDRYTIYTPSHKQLDLLDTQAVEKYFRTHKIDTVIHAAVSGGSRKSEHVENAIYKNMRIFFNIVRNKKYFKKMINLGSGAEYDKSRPLKKIKESDFDKKVPSDDYGFYKYICSKYIEKSNKIINLRIFGLFGKYENCELRFISNALCKSLFDLPITINKNVFFDYVSIDDFVKIVEHFIQNNPKHQIYNIGSGQVIDLITIAEKINKIADKNLKVIVKNKGLNNEYSCDNSRLAQELKNFRFEDFDESVKNLRAWYKARINKLDKKKFLEDKE